MTDPVFELRMENGRSYKSGESILDWSIQSDYLIATDGWSCTFKTSSSSERTNLNCMPVELYVDGYKQLDGRIDTTRIGKRGTAVTVEGRDYIADLTEGNVDPAVSIKAGDRLDKAILQILGPYGITKIGEPEALVEQRTGAKPAKMAKLVTADVKDHHPKDRDGAFELANRIAARHGYTIQPTTERHKITLETPNYLQVPIHEFFRGEDGVEMGGNAIEAEAIRDWSSVPTFIKIAGFSGSATSKVNVNNYDWDLGALAPGFGEEVEAIINQWCIGGRRLPKDASIITPAALYRLMYFKDKEAKTPAGIGAAAWRAACEQMKKTLCYEVKAKGVFDVNSGKYYAINTMAQVHDELAVVNEILWCSSCHRGTTETEGTVTTMQYWRPSTFTIDKEGHGDG